LKKDIFPTRRLKVHEKDWPGERIIIQHDASDLVREAFGLDKKKQDKPADIIPLKPKK